MQKPAFKPQPLQIMLRFSRSTQRLILAVSLFFIIATQAQGSPVHVLMPVYETEDYIESSIQSILDQSHADQTTLILFDDASPDSAIDRATQLLKSQDRLHYTIIRNSKNGGRGHARIQLVKHSKAVNPDAHILWLDSDDYYNDTTFIERFALTMDTTGADMCLFSFEPYFENESARMHEDEILTRRETSERIIKQIINSKTHSLSPKDIQDLYQFTMMGCLKGYAKHFDIPEPECCDYEDFISIVSLFKATAITAIDKDYRPLTYVKRKSSVTGTQPANSFFDVIRQLKKCLSEMPISIKTKMKDEITAFIHFKIAQFQDSLLKLVQSNDRPDITHEVLETYNLHAHALTSSELNGIY